MTTVIPEHAEDVSGATSSAGLDNETPRPAQKRTRTWRIIVRRPLAALSLGYLVALVFIALSASLLAPHSPTATDLANVLSGPTSDHLLGTDALGRDVLSRIMHGSRVSMINAAIAVATFLVVGICSGLIAGFLGSWTDRAFTWVVDIMLAIPQIIVLMVVLATFNSNTFIAMVALGILAAPGFARIIRGITLAVRQELYVAAARVSGLPNRHIASKHVLPRMTGPIIVHGSLFAGAALLIDAGLAYLGFGAEPPTPTWGNMITEAASVLGQQPWLLAPPGVVLGLGILAFGLLGDTVRDAAAERTGKMPARKQLRNNKTQGGTGPVDVEYRTDAAALLAIRNVSIALPTNEGVTTVVDDLNLDIHPGETVGLVGESGCGKSISASAIVNLLPAGGRFSRGNIYFDGTDLAAISSKALQRFRGSEIAMISQEPISSLDPVFTAGQQLSELVRRHHGGSRRQVRTRTLELLASVSLPEPELVARRYPHELSGGMAQRVGIAMALAGEPRLLIADEPTTALDVTVQAEILRLLRRLQTEHNMAILLITHDWGVVAQICNRAYVMYAGQIVEGADILDMFEQPLHPYTIGLFGSTPRRAVPGQPLAAIPGGVPSPDEWPFGCRFRARCPLAIVDCSRQPIPLFEPRSGHHTRCIRHSELHLEETYG